MICGVGVDIVSLERMASSLQNGGSIFVDKIFTPYEQEKAANHPQPIAYYAKIFAAKEAIVKLFGAGYEDQLEISEIEIQEGQNHEPMAVLYGSAKVIFDQRAGEKIFLSLSYEKSYAIAFAVSEGSIC
jgi:holo-[acyl-carrier protein] synthase